jgi:hypothetical protein
LPDEYEEEGDNGREEKKRERRRGNEKRTENTGDRERLPLV